MEQEHIWLGSCRGAGRLGERSLPGRTLLLHHCGELEEVLRAGTYPRPQADPVGGDDGLGGQPGRALSLPRTWQ